MEGLKQLLTYITNQFKFWFIINEWDIALQMRNGKILREVKAGLFFKIPFIDFVYKQPLREQDIILSQINFTSKDGANITTSVVIVYKIENITEFYNGYSEPNSIIANKTSAEICEYIIHRNYDNLNLKKMEKFILNRLKQIKNKGFEFEELRITTFSKVKTFRIIKDDLYGQHSNNLETKTF